MFLSVSNNQQKQNFTRHIYSSELLNLTSSEEFLGTVVFRGFAMVKYFEITKDESCHNFLFFFFQAQLKRIFVHVKSTFMSVTFPMAL